MLKFFIPVYLFLVVLFTSGAAMNQKPLRQIQGIRLAGLGGVYYGRVEVLIDGKWATICDDAWDDADAKVVCRSLGMKGGVAYERSWFGRGTGNITMTSVKCQGDEPSLSYCDYDDSENYCSHREDAGVMCDKESVNDN